MTDEAARGGRDRTRQILVAGSVFGCSMPPIRGCQNGNPDLTLHPELGVGPFHRAPARSLLWLFVSCLLSTFASAGSERLTVAYPQWPPYKIVQNGSIGGIDALVLDEIARRTGLEFDYVECP